MNQGTIGVDELRDQLLNQSSSTSNQTQSIRNSPSMFGHHARAIEDLTRRRREARVGRPPSQLRSQERLSPEPETNQSELILSIFERNARLRDEFNQREQETNRNQENQTSIPSQFLQFLQPTTTTTTISQTHSEEENQLNTNSRPISPPIHLPPTPPTNRVNLPQTQSSTRQGLYLFNGHFHDPQNNLISVNLEDLSRPSSVSDDSSDDSNQQTTETSDLLNNDSESDQNAALFFTSLQNGHRSRIRRRGRDDQLNNLIDNTHLGPDPHPWLVEAAAHHNSMAIAEALGIPSPYDNLPERTRHEISSELFRRPLHLTGVDTEPSQNRSHRLDRPVEPPADISMGFFQAFEMPGGVPSTETEEVLPRSSTNQTTDLTSSITNPQSRSSENSNGRPNQITQLSNTRRRRLMSNNESTDWRHALVEQMHNDFDAGLDRTMAVNRLRQLTMNHHANNNTSNPTAQTSLSAEPIRRNLVGTLRNIRSQRQAGLNNHRGMTQGSSSTPSDPISRSSIQVYLVYCGAPQADQSIFAPPQTLPRGFQFANPTSSTSSPAQSSRSSTQGCGKLITIRSINPSHAARKPIPNGMFKTPIENVLSSDSFPISQSVGIIDHESRAEFENDESNPCKDHEAGHDKFVCYCTKEYLGCLSCGHIVGHWVKVHCFYCERWSSTQHRFFYYLSRITYIPRYENGSISDYIPTDRSLSFYSQQRQQGHHKKGQPLQAKQLVYENDLRDGYIGSEEDWKDRAGENEGNEGGLMDDVMGNSTCNTMNQRMRSSIMDSSVDDLDGSIDLPSQPSQRYLFSSRRTSNQISSTTNPIGAGTRTGSGLNGQVRQIHHRRWSSLGLGQEVERNDSNRTSLNRSGAIRLSNSRPELNPNPDPNPNPQQADAEEEEEEGGEMVTSMMNRSLVESSNTRRSSRVSNSPISYPVLNPRADSLDLDGIPIRDSRPRISISRMNRASEEMARAREERREADWRERELNDLIDMGEIRDSVGDEEEQNWGMRIEGSGSGRRRRGGLDEEEDEEEGREGGRGRSRRRIHTVTSNDDDDREGLYWFGGSSEVCAR